MSSHETIPTNDAVRWNGTRYGLTPTLSDHAEQLVKGGEISTPQLMDALADPSRFVTAHVILTRIAGAPYDAFPAWNGLEVILEANGAVRIDPEQRHKLVQQWKPWFEATMKR